MKKLFFVYLSCFLFCYTYAQNEYKVFKPFRVDINVGVPTQIGKGIKEGLSFSIEPKYAVNDQLQLGLLMEAAIMTRGISDASNVSVSINANASYLATGDYYFSSNRFRPLVGLGAGVCRLGSAGLYINNGNQGDITLTASSELKFESMIRTGFEFGHGRLAFEYNYIPKTIAKSDQNTPVTFRNSYFNIKLGVAIGGGRLKK